MQFYQTLIAACMATSALAQTTTVNLFIDYMNPDVQWEASVVDVIDGTATYAATCVPGPQETDGCAMGAAVSIQCLSTTQLQSTNPA